MTAERRVVCAAIRAGRAVILGPRHFDGTMHRLIDMHYELQKTGARPEADWYQAEQGFIDQHGEFLTREDARKVAQDAGQIIRRVGGDEARLYSENLY